MTDLNQEDATMLQGLSDALMHLTNRLLSATEVANQVAELRNHVGELEYGVTKLTGDVETYRNRNLDLDAALSAVRKERDEFAKSSKMWGDEYDKQCSQRQQAEIDRDEAINKQLEADQRADDLGQTIKRLQDDLHAKNVQLELQTTELYGYKSQYEEYKALFDSECKHSEVLRIKLNRIEDVLSGAAVDPVVDVPAVSKEVPTPEQPSPVAEVPAIQAIEDREIPQETPQEPAKEWEPPTRYGSSW